MKLIVGLGNPEQKIGERYAHTRHNLGFEVLEHFRKKLNLGEWELNNKFKAELVKMDGDLLLVRPQTYMNNSGMAVSALANFYKIKPEDVVVIHDEMDLPLGQIKIRLGGAAAGHHGVESIISLLGNDKFIRIRLGIGNLHTQGAEKRGGEHFNTEHFVLEPFLPGERSKVKHMLKQAIQALELLLNSGLEKAQNQYN